jgi:hypothetical protein
MAMPYLRLIIVKVFHLLLLYWLVSPVLAGRLVIDLKPFIVAARGPTITVSEPLANERVTGTNLLVRGNAAGKGGIAAVRLRLNGADWVTASGTKSWSNSLTLLPGTNRIDMYAEEASGKRSKTNSITFQAMDYSGIYFGTEGGRVGTTPAAAIVARDQVIRISSADAIAEIKIGRNGIFSQMMNGISVSGFLSSTSLTFRCQKPGRAPKLFKGSKAPVTGPYERDQGMYVGGYFDKRATFIWGADGQVVAVFSENPAIARSVEASQGNVVVFDLAPFYQAGAILYNVWNPPYIRMLLADARGGVISQPQGPFILNRVLSFDDPPREVGAFLQTKSIEPRRIPSVELSLKRESQAAELSFFTSVGQSYCLQCSKDLVSWENLLPSFVANEEVFRFVDSSTNNVARFYRLVVE